MSIPDHPGYLGWTSQGVILIHADWPTYAIEHGVEYSLERLGQFPPATRFFVLDDIDQCILMRMGEPIRTDADFDARVFHVALWHEDLLQLFRQGWIEGVGGMTAREWAVRQSEKMRGWFARLQDGRKIPVPGPNPDDFEADEATVAAVSQHGMTVTDAGMTEFARLMRERRAQIPTSIRDRVEPLIKFSMFDSAVREACVVLETSLRTLTRSEFFGHQLIDKYCAEIGNRVIASHVKWIRTELRTCFKFVRNDFMHSLREISEPQCVAIVCRVAGVLAHVLEACSDDAG